MELSANDKALLRAYFVKRPVRRAYIFGSFARREGAPQSDIDILVELDHSHPIGMRFFSFQEELEELLHRKVDLVSEDGISSHVRPYIEKDKVLIYER
jgi:predicted nucleotidyltransferase